MNGYFGDKWDFRFTDLARYISHWSKDPSTKCGAVLVRPDKSIASIGFNGLPPRVLDTNERLESRELKYKMIRHAEVNCIDFCKDQDLSSYVLYIWPPGLVPCTGCSGHLIANGIRAVVITKAFGETSFVERWKGDNLIARDMLREAGVSIFVTDFNTDPSLSDPSDA